MFKWALKKVCNRNEQVDYSVNKPQYTVEGIVKCYLTAWETNQSLEEWNAWLYLHIDNSLIEKALPIAQEQWYNEHPPRNINDPVLAILKAMRERPNTFKYCDDKSGWEDTITEWKVGNHGCPSWMNESERSAFCNEFLHWASGAEEGKKQEQRQAVMALYRKGE